tara:strand:+ start:619 stop:816 length:198 start_codon:yes stop_codon:yes gene_type:complete
MEILGKEKNFVDVRISYNELEMLKNGLNEVCNGLELFEFETRMGFKREEVKSLFSDFKSIIDNIK